jgi:hypothetical protein
MYLGRSALISDRIIVPFQKNAFVHQNEISTLLQKLTVQYQHNVADTKFND